MWTETIRFELVDTRLGPCAVVGGRRGLRAVILPGLGREALRREVRRRFPGAVEEDRGLRGAARALARYFETGRPPRRDLRLDLDRAGPFARRVYEALREVPPGETVTYAEIARRIGHPGAHRAVGNALARNPLPVFIPCHRVLRSDGGVGGFTAEGGIALKRAMLALEGGPE